MGSKRGRDFVFTMMEWWMSLLWLAALFFWPYAGFRSGLPGCLLESASSRAAPSRGSPSPPGLQKVCGLSFGFTRKVVRSRPMRPEGMTRVCAFPLRGSLEMP